MNADWSDDGSVALITQDGKWGPHDIFLVEFKNGKLSRTTNLLAKAHDLLLPDYCKAKAERYNEYFDFIFESEDNPICKLGINLLCWIEHLHFSRQPVPRRGERNRAFFWLWRKRNREHV